MIQSRRDFLKNAGKLAVAASVASVLPMSAMAEDAVEHPYTYAKIDPEVAADRAYARFSELGGCCVGVVAGIVDCLAEAVGAPYTNFPVKMFQNGAAGYGQNSLCGCLGGAAAAIGLVCPAADSKAVLKEVMTWYKTSELPTYDRGSAPAIAKVVPGSVNCADSLMQFFTAAPEVNYDMSHPDRINRCACLTADVARKTAEALNAHFGV